MRRACPSVIRSPCEIHAFLAVVLVVGHFDGNQVSKHDRRGVDEQIRLLVLVQIEGDDFINVIGRRLALVVNGGKGAGKIEVASRMPD